MKETNVFEGTRVRLRAVEPEDAETFVAWDLDSEAARTGYFIPPPNSLEQATRWAQTESSRDGGGDDDRFRFVIETLDRTMVGTIMTGECDRRNGTFTYGLGLARPFWRKGYASEAIRLVL